MKNGLYYESGELVYYENGSLKHAGVIEADGVIYYIGSGGRAVKGQHVVHRKMANDLLKKGTYTFGDDYALIPDSYIPPKKQKKKHRKRRQSKRKLRIRAAVAVAVLLCAVVSWVIIDQNGMPVGKTINPSSNQAFTPVLPEVVLPSFENEVLLCTGAAKQYYDGNITAEEAYRGGMPYAPFVFEYGHLPENGLLLLSENERMSDAESYVLEAGNGSLVIDNLKTGTTYYYKVSAGGKEYPGTFRTAKATRFVSIPGAANTRDIGGYQTLDGKTVRQGMLIRGTELDGLVEASYLLPTSAVAQVRNAFGFVYEFDLRQSSLYPGDYHSRLGSHIGHKFYSAPQYGQIFNVTFVEMLRSIFSDLADPEKYPMYMHCTWGKDRTGTIIFLLQGLLNLPEDMMRYDYTLSAFYHPDIFQNAYLDAIINGLQGFDGNTLQEKIVTFLTTVVGVTENEIASIRSILLED